MCLYVAVVSSGVLKKWANLNKIHTQKNKTEYLYHTWGALFQMDLARQFEIHAFYAKYLSKSCTEGVWLF